MPPVAAVIMGVTYANVSANDALGSPNYDVLIDPTRAKGSPGNNLILVDMDDAAMLRLDKYILPSGPVWATLVQDRGAWNENADSAGQQAFLWILTIIVTTAINKHLMFLEYHFVYLWYTALVNCSQT